MKTEKITVEVTKRVGIDLSVLVSTGLYGRNESEAARIIIDRWLWDNKGDLDRMKRGDQT